MGNQRTSGLTKRGGIWHIDKQFRGARICESTGTGDIGQAREYLAKRISELSLQDFIAKRRQDGVKTKTLNMALAVVRRVLNLASSEWMDRQGKTWLETAPKIKLFSIKDARSPYPLSREEQALLFQELPDHLARMALFKVNTGLREQEVCGLTWDYEVNVPELDTSVFIIRRAR
jgi:integrase